MPSVSIKTGINGNHTHLASKSACDFVDELRPANGSTIDADFVGTSSQKSFYIAKFVDAPTYGKGYVYLLSYTRHHFCERLSSLKRCSYVKEHQLVSTLQAVGFAQFHRVACTSQVDKVCAFHRFAVFDV
jgi:hypothetical protein